MIDNASPEDRPPRWQHRLAEFEQMLDLFMETDAVRRERPLSQAEEAGLIKFFDLAVELGWKTMALWLRAEGIEVKMLSPLNAIREAARVGLISDADVWSAAVERRNVIAHTYDADAFGQLVADAGALFLPHLEAARRKLRELARA